MNESNSYFIEVECDDVKGYMVVKEFYSIDVVYNKAIDFATTMLKDRNDNTGQS
jgi:hypothetical protein